LNLQLIAEKQATNTQLQEALAKQPPKYEDTLREGIKLDAQVKTEAIYVPVSLHTSILLWYHTTLQHAGIKYIQATLKEHFY
jgi:hypothetical protein